MLCLASVSEGIPFSTDRSISLRNRKKRKRQTMDDETSSHRSNNNNNTNSRKRNRHGNQSSSSDKLSRDDSSNASATVTCVRALSNSRHSDEEYWLSDEEICNGETTVSSEDDCSSFRSNKSRVRAVPRRSGKIKKSKVSASLLLPSSLSSKTTQDSLSSSSVSSSGTVSPLKQLRGRPPNKKRRMNYTSKDKHSVSQSPNDERPSQMENMTSIPRLTSMNGSGKHTIGVGTDDCKTNSSSATISASSSQQRKRKRCKCPDLSVPRNTNSSGPTVIAHRHNQRLLPPLAAATATGRIAPVAVPGHRRRATAAAVPLMAYQLCTITLDTRRKRPMISPIISVADWKFRVVIHPCGKNAEYDIQTGEVINLEKITSDLDVSLIFNGRSKGEMSETGVKTEFRCSVFRGTKSGGWSDTANNINISHNSINNSACNDISCATVSGPFHTADWAGRLNQIDQCHTFSRFVSKNELSQSNSVQSSPSPHVKSERINHNNNSTNEDSSLCVDDSILTSENENGGNERMNSAKLLKLAGIIDQLTFGCEIWCFHEPHHCDFDDFANISRSTSQISSRPPPPQITIPRPLPPPHLRCPLPVGAILPAPGSAAAALALSGPPPIVIRPDLPPHSISPNRFPPPRLIGLMPNPNDTSTTAVAAAPPKSHSSSGNSVGNSEIAGRSPGAPSAMSSPSNTMKNCNSTDESSDHKTSSNSGSPAANSHQSCNHANEECSMVSSAKAQAALRICRAPIPPPGFVRGRPIHLPPHLRGRIAPPPPHIAAAAAAAAHRATMGIRQPPFWPAGHRIPPAVPAAKSMKDCQSPAQSGLGPMPDLENAETRLVCPVKSEA